MRFAKPLQGSQPHAAGDSHPARDGLVPILRSRLGPTNSEFHSAVEDLAVALLELGEVDESISVLERASKEQVEAEGRTHERSLGMVLGFAKHCERAKRFAEAARQYAAVYAAARPEEDKGEAILLWLGCSEARMLRMDGRPEEAAAVLERAWQEAQSPSKSGAGGRRFVAKALVAHYDATKDEESKALWQKRLAEAK